MKSYYIFTLGCQMNESDSERISSVLDLCGLKATDEKSADLIIVNACSVRQKPIDRIWGKIKVWKNKARVPKIYATGCILDSDRKKLNEKVNGIFEIDDLASLPKLLHLRPLSTYHQTPDTYFDIEPARSNPKTAFVPIMTGCNNFCTYCVVPYTRDRERSRAAKDIICEIETLVKRGYKEIMLLGQNVNSYNGEFKNQKSIHSTGSGLMLSEVEASKIKINFVELLKQIIKIPGKFEIKFMTSHPKDLSDDLIDLIATEPKIAKELHLPVQSGDDKILRKMNRKYTAKQFYKLVKKLRSAISDLRLSTDIIVGFPTETKKAFRNTVKLCKKAKFDMAYIAQYSPRPGTAAYRLKDDVPREEKKRRWRILENLINK